MIARARVAFTYKKSLFKSKFNLNFMKKLVKCYVWNIALYGAAETWTLKVDQKNLESFELWYYRRTEKISWTDLVRNEEVLLRVKEDRSMLHMIKRTANSIGHIFCGDCLLKQVIEGKIDGRIVVMGRWGRRHEQLLDEFKE